MAQNYTINVYQSDHNALSDMQNVENNLECLRSNFSGTSSPANALAGHPWYDTGASSRNGGDNQNLLKVYNQTRSVWYGVMTGDLNQKIPVYRNDQMDGWVIDTSVTDKIIAVKGGSTYTTGGVTAGSWTISGLTKAAHTHADGTLAMANHIHTLGVDGETSSNYSLGDAITINFGKLVDLDPGGNRYDITSASTGNPSSNDVSGNTGAQSDAGITSDSSWRPAAAVHTIQYLDI